MFFGGILFYLYPGSSWRDVFEPSIAEFAPFAPEVVACGRCYMLNIKNMLVEIIEQHSDVARGMAALRELISTYHAISVMRITQHSNAIVRLGLSSSWIDAKKKRVQ
jgi:hypothetical protein